MDDASIFLPNRLSWRRIVPILIYRQYLHDSHRHLNHLINMFNPNIGKTKSKCFPNLCINIHLVVCKRILWTIFLSISITFCNWPGWRFNGWCRGKKYACRISMVWSVLCILHHSFILFYLGKESLWDQTLMEKDCKYSSYTITFAFDCIFNIYSLSFSESKHTWQYASIQIQNSRACHWSDREQKCLPE